LLHQLSKTIIDRPYGTGIRISYRCPVAVDVIFKRNRISVPIGILAITAYKLNDLETAEELFREIAEKEGRRSGKAARLERKISRMR